MFRSSKSTLGRQARRSAGETHPPTRTARAADDLAVICDRERPAEQEALRFVASFLREIGELFPGLHPFGQDRYPKRASEADHGPNDSGGLRVLEIADERFVDLHLVEGKGLQIRQRRVA